MTQKTIEKHWLDFRAEMQKRVGSSIDELVWTTVRLAFFAGAGAATVCLAGLGQSMAEEVHTEISAMTETLAKAQKRVGA